MHNVRVSETKLTAENSFIINQFALADKKSQNMVKALSLWSIDLSLNP